MFYMPKLKKTYINIGMSLFFKNLNCEVIILGFKKLNVFELLFLMSKRKFLYSF